MKKFSAMLYVIGFLLTNAGAISIESYSAATNARYSNNPAFVAEPFDLSGVGRSLDGRWATLVSRNVFLSANHYHPSTSSSVRFYATNNPAGDYVTIDIQSGARVGTSDIWMGILETPVPEGYAYYDFATENVTNLAQFASTAYALQNAYLFGLASGNVAVGRNVLDGWLDNVNAGGTIDDAIFSVDNSPGDPNYVTYESQLQTGDSGAPLFVDIGGELVLVGINWFVGSVTIGMESETVSGYSYVGNYDGQIQATIQANPVPEPSVLGLVMMAAALWVLRRRGRRYPLTLG